MKKGIASAVILWLFVPLPATADCITNQYGQVVCGAGECTRDQYGKIFCAPVGGGAMRDEGGKVVCGVGYCARERDGSVSCSTVPGGGAATDSYGKVKCYKGCSTATTSRCTEGE